MMKKYFFTLLFIVAGQYMLADGATDFTVKKDRLCDEHYYSLVKLKVKRPEPILFSINAQGGKVEFSPGNLQYQPSTNMFRFATRQWEYVGDGVNTSGVKWDSMGLDGNVYSVNSNNNLVSKKYGGWIDLFGWGTSGFVRSRVDNKDPYVSNIYPYSTSKRTINTTYNYYGYGPSTGISGVYQHIDITNPISRNYDWGQYNYIYSKWISYDTTRAAPTGRDSIVYDSTYYHERIWRTLTNAEWDYLFKRRIERKTQPAWALAKVDNKYEGILLFPDDFELSEAKKVGFANSGNISYGNNTYASMSLENFQALEKLGVVFLPKYAHYWSATSNGTQYAKSLNGPHQTNVLVDDPRYTRNQVRLVKDNITSTEFIYNTADALVNADYATTSQTFDFTAYTDWRAESTVPWLKVTKVPLTSVNGKLTSIPLTSSTVYDGAGTHRLKIDVVYNEGFARTGSIVVMGRNKQFFIIVKQNAGTPAVVKDTMDTIPCGVSDYVWHIDYKTHTKDIPIIQKTGTKNYYDTLRNQKGGDSIIWNLKLTNRTIKVEKKPLIYDTLLCGLTTYTWTITYDSKRTVTKPITQTTGTQDYFDTLRSVYGCDSVIAQLKLTLKEECGFYFSVSPTQQVKIASGNLQYNAVRDEWRFAERQFDRIGNGKQAVVPGGKYQTAGYGVTTVFWEDNGETKPCDNNLISKTYGGWQDLFAWGTSTQGGRVGDAYAKYFNPYDLNSDVVNATYNYYGYGPSYGGGRGSGAKTDNIDINSGSNVFFDWGYANEIYDGKTKHKTNTWRTLTSAEWTYLLTTREVDGKDSAFTYVRLKYGSNATDTVSGVVLYPDEFTFALAGVTALPFGAEAGIQSIDMATWSALEKAGCVFLPNAGAYSYENNVLTVMSTGLGASSAYWSSTASSVEYANSVCFNFTSACLCSGLNTYRMFGLPVRLVRDKTSHE